MSARTSADSAALPQLPAASFYRDLGDGRYASTVATAGPWSERTQHGGPPSALIGRALERHAPRPGFRVCRVTLELPRPVPVGDVTVEVRTVRSGRRAELVEGEILSNGEPVLFARAWRMLASPAETPALRPRPAPPELPAPQPAQTMKAPFLDGYVAAMEWRFEPGRNFDHLGPGTAWARQRIPLVAGEQDTPLTRALTLADSSWAVGFELDHHTRLVINTDITLALHREPVGEWFCVRAQTAASPAGSGLAEGHLDDAEGDVGRVLQTLLIADR